MEADRALLAQNEAHIRDIQSLPPDLQRSQSLSELHEAKAVIQNRLDAFIYPVLTLPNEVVSEIFIQFLPAYPKPPPLVGTSSPTLLTHICQKWRAIALATPKLWRVIDMCVRAYTRNPKGRNEIGALWAERSKSCPISVHYTNDVPRSELLTVIRHRPRWEHLAVCLAEGPTDILDGPMPLLRSLKLELSQTCAPWPTFTFENAPLLQKAILAYHAARSVELPWTQLTSLTLWSAPMTDVLKILPQTPQLVYLDFRLWVTKDESTDSTLPDIPLLFLEALVMTPAGCLWSGMLHMFVVPSLLRLDVLERFLEPDEPIESLKSFMAKSGCKLEDLLITFGRFSEKSYRDAFPWIPKIEITGERFIQRVN